MFGHRTPLKAAENKKSPLKPGANASTNVRRSVKSWEAPNCSPDLTMTEKTSQAGPAEIKTKLAFTQESVTLRQARRSVDTLSPPSNIKYSDLTAEAKACLVKTKLHLNSSRNLKTEIKNDISEARERLYQLVKEVELELKLANRNMTRKGQALPVPQPVTQTSAQDTDTAKILQKMEFQTDLLLIEGHWRLPRQNECARASSGK
ncbi:hypothetical protein PYW08_007928 [Mythimna loreyi]|uniref:Uncharacterized protein n=1 Tax=Mythimna loreyi TaxID=667449 RepID=A0ACC2QFM8_9NEOP|nr:hypothetical protein PYW08_007928 [Mythimna loreyi]